MIVGSNSAFAKMIGQKIPDHWRRGVDFHHDDSNVFSPGEAVVVSRSNGTETMGVVTKQTMGFVMVKLDSEGYEGYKNCPSKIVGKIDDEAKRVRPEAPAARRARDAAGAAAKKSAANEQAALAAQRAAQELAAQVEGEREKSAREREQERERERERQRERERALRQVTQQMELMQTEREREQEQMKREIDKEREKTRRLERAKEKMTEEALKERNRMEAEWEKRHHDLMEQHARDKKEAEQRNQKQLELMQQLQSAMDNLKSERQTSGMSFARYQEKVQENRCMFLKCVEEMDKVKTIPVSIGVVGRTSAGKSSLLNRMFGITCKVGATRCTTGVQEVYRYKDTNMHHDISIWDVFGFNDEQAYESIETIKHFVSLHAVLLLYRDDIGSCKNTIELFRAAEVFSVYSFHTLAAVFSLLFSFS